MAKKNLAKWRRFVPLAILVVYWPLMFVTTHLSPVRLGRMDFHGHDVFLHSMAFFFLTLLYWRVRYGGQYPDPRTSKPYLVLVLMGVYGALDEITQTIVGRTGSWTDWLSDLGGAALALGMLFFFRRTIYWLIFYWLGLFFFTHSPNRAGLLRIMPEHMAQFEMVYLMIAYLILTLLWIRSMSPPGRIVMDAQVVILTLLALPLYALLDRGLCRWTGGTFSPAQLVGCLIGIAFGLIVCAACAESGAEKKDDTADQQFPQPRH